MMRHRQRLAFAASCLFPVLAYASDLSDIQSWLEKMQHASHTLNYEGHFVYSQADQLSVMQIVHAAGAAGERERLISLDKIGREVIRDNDKVTCILPDKKSVMVETAHHESQFPPSFPTDISSIEKVYDFKLGSQDTVAGQTVQQLVISPKDNYRYGYQLWIDNHTGLLLKRHTISENGKLVEQFMFTQINYPQSIPDEWLKATTPSEGFVVHQADASQDDDMQGLELWKATDLPTAFTADIVRGQRRHRGKVPLEHLVYSDGIASVSVFIEDGTDQTDESNLIGSTRMGAVNAYGHRLDHYYITAVGEVPQVTVKRIGDSITQVRPQ